MTTDLTKSQVIAVLSSLSIRDLRRLAQEMGSSNQGKKDDIIRRLVLFPFQKGGADDSILELPTYLLIDTLDLMSYTEILQLMKAHRGALFQRAESDPVLMEYLNKRKKADWKDKLVRVKNWLRDNDLEEDPPHTLEELENLKSLHFPYDPIDTIPPEIGRLTKLKELTLYGSFENIPPEIGNLTKLKKLTLYGTFENIPPEIGNLTELEELRLDGYFKTIPPEIGNLTKLKELQLGGDLENIPPEIGNLTNLERIMLYGSLETIPPEIGRLTNLTFLGLSGNRLETIPQEFFNQFKMVELYKKPRYHLNEYLYRVKNYY